MRRKLRRKIWPENSRVSSDPQDQESLQHEDRIVRFFKGWSREFRWAVQSFIGSTVIASTPLIFAVQNGFNNPKITTAMTIGGVFWLLMTGNSIGKYMKSNAIISSERAEVADAVRSVANQERFLKACAEEGITPQVAAYAKQEELEILLIDAQKKEAEEVADAQVSAA